MAGHTLRVSFRARSGRGVWLRDDSLETRPRLRTSPRCTWPSTTSCSQRARREPQTPRSAGRGGGAADAGDAARWPRWLQSGLRGRLCSALASFERGPHALTRVAGSRARALRAFLLPRAEMRRDEGAPPHHCDRPAGGGGGDVVSRPRPHRGVARGDPATLVATTALRLCVWRSFCVAARTRLAGRPWPAERAAVTSAFLGAWRPRWSWREAG